MHDKQTLLENIRWGVAIVCVMPLIIASIPFIATIALAEWVVNKMKIIG